MVDVDSTTGTGHPRKALDNASSYLQARRRETPPRHHNEQQKRRQECPGRNTQKLARGKKYSKVVVAGDKQSFGNMLRLLVPSQRGTSNARGGKLAGTSASVFR